eukprot:1159968-Pelagomonas_calceolata.AAC.9
MQPFLQTPPYYCAGWYLTACRSRCLAPACKHTAPLPPPDAACMTAGRDGGNDAGLGAPPEAVAQQARELGVSIRHVAAVLYQRSDHTAQGEQGLVNGAGLACASIFCARPGPRIQNTYARKCKRVMGAQTSMGMEQEEQGQLLTRQSFWSF